MNIQTARGRSETSLLPAGAQQLVATKRGSLFSTGLRTGLQPELSSGDVLWASRMGPGLWAVVLEVVYAGVMLGLYGFQTQGPYQGTVGSTLDSETWRDSRQTG